jgi:hypothetical protein
VTALWLDPVLPDNPRKNFCFKGLTDPKTISTRKMPIYALRFTNDLLIDGEGFDLNGIFDDAHFIFTE